MDATTQQQPAPANLRPWQHIAIFLLACAIIISRRPDAILHPQFWYEDGPIFYAQAYNLGWWSSLFRPWTGYYMTLPRLGAALALLVPLSLAPLLMNLIAICVEAIPVNLLLSKRCSAWGTLRFRGLLALSYLVLPNSGELNATISWSQWPMALCAFLLLIAPEPPSRLGRFLELTFLAFSGLNGPFCVLLLPIAILSLWRYRDRWRCMEIGVLSVFAVIQSWSLLNGGYASRPHGPIGANPAMFARLIGAQAYLGALLGANLLSANDSIRSLGVFIFISIGGTILVVICLRRWSWEMRLFFVLSALILAASLISPMLGPLDKPTVWETLAYRTTARYWIFPNLVFIWSLLWFLGNRNLFLKPISIFLLSILCLGVMTRWQYFHFPNGDFTERARAFESAPAGTVFVFDEKPTGWVLRLVKR